VIQFRSIEFEKLDRAVWYSNKIFVLTIERDSRILNTLKFCWLAAYLLLWAMPTLQHRITKSHLLEKHFSTWQEKVNKNYNVDCD
jgi:hypothetical protein